MIQSNHPLTIDLSVNGLFHELGEDVNADTLARANIKRRGAIANALALMPPWAEVYVAGPPFVGGNGPLLSCFAKDLKTDGPPFAIAGHSALRVYLQCRNSSLRMVSVILIQGRFAEMDADVLAEWFAREALKHLGPPSFETAQARIWCDSGRELYAKKGKDLVVRWALRRGNRIAVP